VIGEFTRLIFLRYPAEVLEFAASGMVVISERLAAFTLDYHQSDTEQVPVIRDTLVKAVNQSMFEDDKAEHPFSTSSQRVRRVWQKKRELQRMYASGLLIHHAA
jgi:hypothetical protein